MNQNLKQFARDFLKHLSDDVMLWFFIWTLLAWNLALTIVVLDAHGTLTATEMEEFKATSEMFIFALAALLFVLKPLGGALDENYEVDIKSSIQR